MNPNTKKQLRSLVAFLVLILILIAATLIFFPPTDIFGARSDRTDGNSARVPVLMYHHFVIEEDYFPGTMISGELFERQIKALSEAGYTAISFEELRDFVLNNGPLPEMPLLITIDDGYGSVYDVAFPILKKYDMKATVFIIGISHGKSYYRNTDHEIFPRFNDAQALEMVGSGIMSIQSHSYDMHQFALFEDGPFREGILQMDGEDGIDYIRAFNADFELAAEQIENMVGLRPFVYSYPYGHYNDMSDKLLGELGVKVTLIVEEGVNTVKRGAPNTLFRMKRFNVPGDMMPETLLKMLEKGAR